MEEEQVPAACLAPSAKRRKKSEPPSGERDCTDLFCLAPTLKCALDKCVCCVYKLCLHSSPEHRLPPNGRPESCRRVMGSVSSTKKKGNKKQQQKKKPAVSEGAAILYGGGGRVLTVGDGDLSFSLSLARSGVAVDCTTLAADLAELEQLYDGLSTVKPAAAELETLANAQLGFGVDATRLAETLSWKVFYDRIVFNFPCIAVEAGLDGQSPGSQKIDEDALRQNRALVSQFAKSALDVLCDGGELHVTHKSTPPFGWWKIIDCVVVHEELAACGALVFDRTAFPPYANRKAKDKAGFPAHDGLTYVFRASNGNPRSSLKPTLPSTTTTRSIDESATSAYCENDDDEEERTTTSLLLPVTPSLLRQIRTNLLS